MRRSWEPAAEVSPGHGTARRERRKEAVSAASFQKGRKSSDFGDREDFADDRLGVLRTAGQGLGAGLSALCGAAAWC